MRNVSHIDMFEDFTKGIVAMTSKLV